MGFWNGLASARLTQLAIEHGHFNGDFLRSLSEDSRCQSLPEGIGTNNIEIK